MRVVGTAGHVDHGKSTLVKRLTGIDPDRLAEEKKREMTIDLGFAWLKLPHGETVGFVDVPGHRDFIENMLAGVGGIDAVLLVIAADEGIMPQTREHLAILDLLGIEHGLIVLSKIDLIDDPDWLTLIEGEISDIVSGTTLRAAPLIRVSAHTGVGLPKLIDALTHLLNTMPAKPLSHQPRLPIDRVFSVSGFGTVVTGTLLGAALHIGDEVELQPAGLRGRVRGLQSYQQTVDIAEPGSRVAVNISGVDKKAVERGFVLTYPAQLQSTVLVDVRFRHLQDTGRPLKHNAEVKVFVGAAEATGHVRLLSDETLPPGAEGWLQIRLEKPLALTQGDRFILRYPSPSQTIGGGIVVNPNPGRRWKRFQSEVIHELETRMLGTPAERLAQAATSNEPINPQVLQAKVGYSAEAFKSALQAALAAGLLVQFPDGSVLSRVSWQGLLANITAQLRVFHEAEPMRLGMPREELRSRVGLKNTTLTILLDQQTEVVADNGNTLRLATHAIQFTADQERRIQALFTKMAEAPYTPPAYSEAAQIVSADVLRALIELGEVVQVQSEVIFMHKVYNEMVSAVLEIIDATGDITAGALRDRFGTTRKYAIGLLEYLDSISITRRVGDTRVRGARSQSAV
jgi:selenocysteine-specific elongation factor